MNAVQPDEDRIEDDGAPTNGLFCFFNAARECGADCMAYSTEPAESKALSTQQKNCTLLVSVERLGRYVGNLTGAVIKIQQKAATEAADRVRLSQTPPPDPRGSKP